MKLRLPAIRLILIAIALMIPAALLVAGERKTERQISLQELPELVRETVLREAAGRDLLEIEEVTTPNKRFYEAEWLEDGMEVEIWITLDGTVVHREIESPDSDDDEDDDDAEDHDH